MAFLASFIQYVVIMIVLVAIAVAGFMIGKALRENKNAKEAALAASKDNEADTTTEA